MKIRFLLFLCCAAQSYWTVSAQVNEEKKTPVLPTPVMEERVSELMADRVTTKMDVAIKELIEVNEKAALLNKEDLMFPADELYGSNWDNKWVNPFHAGGITYPDSCAIDCSSFILPIDNDLRVTSKYGPRRRRMHRGIDLKVQVGDTIRAAFDGKIRIKSFERRGYGYYLVVRHPNGLETVYGHLSKFLTDENEIVRAGQPIALGGNTGRSTGSHLHFETRFLGIDINPADIIDFNEGMPHKDLYVFHNVKINGRKSNIYTSSDTKMVYHRVKSGDTLGKIARMYGVSVTELCRLNGLKGTSTLRIGQSIRCNAGVESASKQEITTKASAAPAQQTTVKATAAAIASLPENTKKGQTENATDDPVFYRIKSGDTLGVIAKRHGTTVEKICELNGITKTTILRLGRSIRCS